MKVVNVSPFHDGLRRNNTMLNRLENEMKAIETAVEGLVALEDSLKGQGGDAIRAFYAECHLPFLQFFMTFKSNYVNVLTQMDSALDALEPDMNGFIRETFLEGEVEAGLTEISQQTSSLTDEANDIMNQVADIVALPHLNDSDVQEGVRDARRKRDITIADLYEFDANQTRALMTIENELSIMETWLADIESLFKGGLTGVHFESKQWAAITLNSGLQTAIDQQTSAVAGGLGNSDQDNLIGTEIKAGAFQALESKRAETIERGAYGSYNLLKFHIYENGLIVKEYQLGTRKPIQYEVVKEVEEEFDDGGFRELDNYFEGTKLAFVDYIHPRAIVQKGFKKMALAIIPGVKPSKYKGNLSVKKTSAVENKSKVTGKDPIKVNYGEQYTKDGRRKVLKQNVEYTTKEGHTYKTDSKGRISSCESKLQLGEGKRNNYAQKVVGREDRLPDDEGGHLIASIFKGSGNMDNLIPMNGNLNKGEWKKLENVWAKQLNKGKSVEVKIKPIYKGDLQRPDSFKIEYKIGNKDWEFTDLKNKPGGK